MTRRSLFGLAFGAALAIACGGPTLTVEKYPGPRRPAEDVAILRFHGSDEALLVMIDGERADIRLDDDVRLHVEILPGEHQVGVVPRSDMQGQLRTVWFTAVPGRTYRVAVVDRGARAFEIDPESDDLVRDVTSAKTAAP